MEEEKLILYDNVIEFITNMKIETKGEIMSKISNWLEENKDDRSYTFFITVYNAIDDWHYGTLKINILPELIQRRAKLIKGEKEEEDEVDLKEQLQDLNDQMEQLKLEEHRLVTILIKRKRKLGLLDELKGPEVTQLAELDDKIEKLAMEIAKLINYMDESFLECRLCGEEAKYSCQVYYCGQECQIKHFNI
jgi:hypothetical protein